MLLSIGAVVICAFGLTLRDASRPAGVIPLGVIGAGLIVAGGVVADGIAAESGDLGGVVCATPATEALNSIAAPVNKTFLI